MKSKITFLLAIVVLASCSAPKYALMYDHHYGADKKQSVAAKEVSPLAINSQELVASTSSEPAILAPSESTGVMVEKTYLQMTKLERKALRTHLRSEIKSYVSAKKADTTQGIHHTAGGMDNDLKLAAIFGAVGIVGLIIGGNVFNIIGGIALLIGVVFFVKWLIRQ